MRPPARVATAALAILLVASAACSSSNGASSSSETTAPDADAHVLETLRRFESERRAHADFAALPASDHRLGADPYAIRQAGPDRFVGLLRGADAVVLLGADLHEIARADAPGSPVGLAVRGDTAYVVGERASAIHTYRFASGKLEPGAPIPLPEARALRDVAAGPNGVLHAVEAERGRLFTLVPDPAAPNGYAITTTPACAGAGAFRVARTESAVLVDCLFDHRIVAFRVDARGLPTGAPLTIQNDGPLWSFAVLEDERGLVVASGGVEDKPLDRTHGSFENIDSFVFVDHLSWGPDAKSWGRDAKVTRLAAVNVSEHGVIVPKALVLTRDASGLSITATGYGGESFASIHLRDAPPPSPRPAPSGATPATPSDATPGPAPAGAAPEIVAHPLPPGTNALAIAANGDMILANPLLDTWSLTRTEHLPGFSVHVPDPPGPPRSAASKLGELLIFTSLIAPWNRSDGPLSRFTCETCHFEGAVDGRTHATGRGDIRATTKPLLGLFNNRPHFSRAKDPDLSSVAHAEFRVAGARSGHDPVFDLATIDRPWFEDLGVTDTDVTALGLRRAFMAFLMDFTPRASPITARRAAFTPTERRGAEAFRDRCETCHEARLASDVPASRQPFDAWERLVFSDAAPLVWGQAKYAKTGVLPYVDDEGARVPSLRRLHAKHPYFTNGSAKTLTDLLARARFASDVFFHDAPPEGAPVTPLLPDEIPAIEAFLRLL